MAMKYHDVSLSDTTVDSTDWVEIDPSGADDNNLQIAIGTGPTNRVGNHILLHKLQMKYQLGGNSANVGNKGGVVTVCVVMDTQTNKAALDTDNVWDTTFDHQLSFRDLEHSGRFKILYQKTFTMRVTSAVDSTTDETHWIPRYAKWYKTFKKPLKIDYDGSTGALTEQTQNSIHLLVSTDITDERVRFDASWRARFTDYGLYVILLARCVKVNKEPSS